MIATQLKSVDEVKAELEAIRAKREAERSTLPGKRDWYGLVYCDSNGYASIIGRNMEGMWLGRADEIIPYLKKRGISGENVDSTLLAVEDFRAGEKEEILHKDFGRPTESKTQSCHLAIKNQQPYISIPPGKSNRATFEDGAQNLASQHPSFKNDPKLLALLESLTKRDIGIPTIHRELNEHGYAVPYRTVGRWVAQMRTKEML